MVVWPWKILIASTIGVLTLLVSLSLPLHSNKLVVPFYGKKRAVRVKFIPPDFLFSMTPVLMISLTCAVREKLATYSRCDSPPANHGHCFGLANPALKGCHLGLLCLLLKHRPDVTWANDATKTLIKVFRVKYQHCGQRQLQGHRGETCLPGCLTTGPLAIQRARPWLSPQASGAEEVSFGVGWIQV